jgi:DNA-binding transcriptional ArsR family regulator
MPSGDRVFPSIDRLVHEPARLAILTVLSACESADFKFLEAATGLSKGNLSVQITRLEEAGLVDVERVIKRKKTRTTVSLRASGKSQIREYWRTLDLIREQASSNKAQKSR